MDKAFMANEDLASKKHVHFTGIKGVGMTAAALCMQDLGAEVTGSDVEADFVTKEVLLQRGIEAGVGFDAQDVPSDTDLLVFTGAHDGIHNPQVLAAKEKGVEVLSHAELVGQLMQGKMGISVCGVGGKTSISAMIATVLDFAGMKPSFLIGVGKVLNLQVPGRMGDGDHFVAEADEYVVSPKYDHTPRFMHQKPTYVVCTNIVHDHPDVYTNISETKKAFADFFSLVPDDGMLVVNGNSVAVREMDLSGKKVVYYGITPDKNDWWIQENFMGEGKQLVEFANQNTQIKLTLSVPGKFNALNALAAYIVCTRLGMDSQTVIQALQLFRGSMRRFEKIGESGQIKYYDDYAHHPSQLVVTLEAAKLWLPLNRIVAVFQPHTYSRTKILLQQFAKSFNYADRVIITDIYASKREQPDESISGQILASEVKKHQPNVTYVPTANLIDYLKADLKPGDALFTLGAGNIYQIHDLLMATN